MRKALFLDRDGVINKEINYLYRIQDFKFNNRIFRLCKKFQDEGYLIFVITNQAGIARGYYTKKDFEIVTKWMINQFLLKKIKITKVYFCPHHPDFSKKCNCRKPNPGMILNAMEEFDIDLSNSVLIGDKKSDIIAGNKAGIGKNILIDANLIPKFLLH